MTSPTAVDIGFGFTKSLIMHDQGYRIAPSLIARAYEDPGFETGFNGHDNGFRVTWEGGDFFVGELARLKSKTAHSTQARSRINGPEALAHLYGALATHYPDGKRDILLATGLPVSWLRDEERYKSEWPGTHNVTVNGRPVTWRIIGVEVGPQGFGAFVDHALDWTTQYKLAVRDRELFEKKVAVVDMGSLTVNLFVFERGVHQKEQSASAELGMRWALERISDEIDSGFGVRFPTHEIDRALRSGYISIDGNVKPLSGIADPILAELAEEQADWVSHVLGQEVRTIPYCLLAGGGAHSLGGYFKSALNREVVVLDVPEVANVRGYLKWAVHLSRRTKSV